MQCSVSTAQIVRQTCHNVTLIVHCLSCFVTVMLRNSLQVVSIHCWIQEYWQDICFTQFSLKLNTQKKMCYWITGSAWPAEVSAVRNELLWKHMAHNFHAYPCTVSSGSILLRPHGQVMIMQFISQEILQNFTPLSPNSHNTLHIILRDRRATNNMEKYCTWHCYFQAMEWVGMVKVHKGCWGTVLTTVFVYIICKMEISFM